MTNINKTFRRLSALFLTLALTLAQVSPVFALRVPQDREGRRLVESGLEESLYSGTSAPSPFVPFAGSSSVLVRPQPVRLDQVEALGYSLEAARHLGQVLQNWLGSKWKAPALILLPDASASLSRKIGRKMEVFLFRHYYPNHSLKSEGLSHLLDLYLNGDPFRLVGGHESKKPAFLFTPSSGNQAIEAAQIGSELNKRGFDVRVEVFVASDIPPKKLQTIKKLGAFVHTAQDYREAVRKLEERKKQMGKRAYVISHGDKAIVTGHMISALQLHALLVEQGGIPLNTVAMISPGGAGGRLGGLGVGFRLLQLENKEAGGIKLLAAGTDNVPPIHLAVQAGHPVPVPPLPGRPAEDGINVDQAVAQALQAILATADASALVTSEQGVSYTNRLWQELKRLGQSGSSDEPLLPEPPAGVALAIPFEHPELFQQGPFQDSNTVIIDETGMNNDPKDIRKIQASALPEPFRQGPTQSSTGLEESGENAAVPGRTAPALSAIGEEAERTRADVRWAINEAGTIQTLFRSDRPAAEERFVEIFHRMDTWDQNHRLAFNELEPKEQNQFSREMYMWLRQFEKNGEGRVIRVERHAPQGTPPHIVPWKEGGLPILAGLSLNAALDVAVEPFTSDDGVKRLRFAVQGGGAMANMARATAAFGAPALLVLVEGGESGDELKNALLSDGIDVKALDGGTDFFTRVSWILRHSRIRLTPPGPGYAGRPLVMSDAQDILRGVLVGRSRFPYDWMVGEQFPDDRAAGFQIKLMNGIGQLNPHVRTFVIPSGGWSAETLRSILTTRPAVVNATWPILAKFLGKSDSAVSYSPDEIALEANRIREQYQLEEIAVQSDQGVIVATKEWSGYVQPLSDWTYQVGRADFMAAHRRIARNGIYDENSSRTSAMRAVMAGKLYRGHEVNAEPLLRGDLQSAFAHPTVRITEWSSIKHPTEAGLEERFHMLEEGKISRDVLVVPARAIGQFAGLEEFLKRLPPSLAHFVVVVGKDPRFNPALRSFPEGDPLDLAVYLAGLEEVDHVGVLGDETLAAGLKERLANFQIPVRNIPWNLTIVLEILGVPRPISQQVGLEELAGDLSTQSGA